MATIQSEEVFDNGFGAEDNLKVHQLLKYFTKTSNIMSILKTNNEEVNKHILNDYIICRFLVEKKPLEEGTKFRSQQERIIFLNELKALQASLIIEYEDSPAKAEQSEQLVEIIPTPVSSSKKRKQNHQNIKELNNDEIDQFEQNRSIRMESPQFDYESYEDDISRGSSKDSYAKPHIDDVELVMLKKKNSLPKMMQKVLKPTNSLIKPRIKKELAEARKMGKLVSPKKEITEDVEPEEKTIEEEDPVVELLPEDEIMVSAAKFGGPHFLFARCKLNLDSKLIRLDDKDYTVSGISVEQVAVPPPVIDSPKTNKTEKKEKKLLEPVNPPPRESPRSKKQAPEVKAKVGRKRKVAL